MNFKPILIGSIKNMANDKLHNRVAGGFSPPAPTTRSMRVRTARFTYVTGP